MERILVGEGSLCYGWYILSDGYILIQTYTGKRKVVNKEYLPYINDVVKRVNLGEDILNFNKYIMLNEIEQLKRRLDNVKI